MSSYWLIGTRSEIANYVNKNVLVMLGFILF